MTGALAIASGARGPGIYTSDLINNTDLNFEATELLVYASESSGSPSLVCSFEISTDGGTSWTTVPGTETTVLSGPGSAAVNAALNAGGDMRVTSTVTGTGSPTITYRVAVLVLAAS
jgi:hypothetical protein